MFLTNQPQEKINSYRQLLKATGALSKLYSENAVPYLDPRAPENIFCKVFDAQNLGRGDKAVDAVAGNIGIGIKTFGYKASQYEKIAEFNSLMPKVSGLPSREMINEIAKSRNDRISWTDEQFKIEQNIYHCVARKKGSFMVYEVPMEKIDIPNISDFNDNGSAITFTDGKSDYKFYRSKSVLLKKFIVPSETLDFDVEIIEDPFDAIANMVNILPGAEYEPADQLDDRPFVILPLFSPRTDGNHKMQKKSGLNMWVASGRKRNSNEAYIPVPKWIHDKFPDFFPSREQSFRLKLPTGKVISTKICQENGKALMSNPNSDLGEWLLRGFFKLEEGEPLTYERLLYSGVDSVIVYSNEDNTYSIDFKKVGSYDEFKDENTNE